MGSQLQQRVWNALRLIPRGRVTTYGEIARYLETKAVRAVGTAVGKNPNAPEVPCHRVVLSSGKIGNYSGGDGTITKISLLKEEGIEVKDEKVVDFSDKFWSYEALA